MFAYAALAFWVLVGIVCVACFIRFVLYPRVERQTKNAALLMWIMCPFQSLHGVSMDARQEWQQNVYMLGLVFLWPALLFFLPVGITRYLREDGA